MSSIIRATTSSGLQVAPDNSGSLQLQTNGTTTAVTIDTSQNVFMGNSGLIAGTSGSPRLYVSGTTPVVDSGAGGQQFIVTSSETSGGDKGGVIGLAGPSAASGVNIKATIAGKYDSAVGGNAGYMQFATLGSAGDLVERMRINSSGIITGTAGNLMLVSETSQATTSGTFKDFTGIPSWVEKITVMLSGVSTSGTSNQQIQLGKSTGVVTSGYLATLTGLTGSSSTSNPTAGFEIGQGASAAGVLNGIVTFTLLNSANGTWSASGTIGFSNTTRNSVISGSVVLSGTLDRVRITTANGTDTFDAGSINIFYE